MLTSRSSSDMQGWLNVGGQGLRLQASPEVLRALEARFAAFMGSPSPSAIEIAIEETHPFEPQLEQVAQVVVTREGSRLLLSGGANGWYDPEQRRGTVHDAAGLGAVDAIVRLALSLSLPPDGGLLFHGAALAMRGGAVALLGASGAGKSTAAAALDGACDELVVVRIDDSAVTLHATPYWRGRPQVAPLRTVVCLERGGATVRRLRGAEAARTLLRHVMRFAAIDVVERPLFDLCAQLCRRVPVEEARCPEGDAFLPFLTRHLEAAA
jgi:hypothetical protein